MNIKQNLALVVSLLLSFSSASASKWAGDWFEVEVILMSQLSDKSSLREVFPNDPFSLNTATSLNLLSAYINPDIASLKQLLPQCGEAFDSRTYLEQSKKWPTFFSTKSIETLHKEQAEAQRLTTHLINSAVTVDDIREANEHDDFSQNAQQEISSQSDDFFDRVTTAQEKKRPTEPQPDNQHTYDESTITVQKFSEKQIAEQEFTEQAANEAPLTEEQRLLVAEAETVFSPYPFIYAHVYPVTYSSSLYRVKDNTGKKQSIKTPPTNQTLCAISKADFIHIASEDAEKNYHHFTVDHMPTRIDGAENLLSKTPYLISENSLKLSNIVTKLKRSKNFKPLLHLGWRQQVFEKNKSIPVSLFAGDNLEAEYKKNLNTFHKQQLAEREKEHQLSAIFHQETLGEDLIKNTINEPSQSVEEQINTQHYQQKITQLIEQLSTIETIEDALTQIDSAPSTLANNEQYLAKNINLENEFIETPQPPLQPWFLNGLLDVYLIGNFLNVEADFSILSHTLAEQESLKLKSTPAELKQIRLQQKRRLISRETHYFDHPYMGIIVQIRRHKRPEPELTLIEELEN